MNAMWGEELTLEMLNKAGFNDIKNHQLERNIQYNIFRDGKNIWDKLLPHNK
ncbi:MAG: hypothetical protein KZQ90_13775 [Candidatus Thiodiazotropha sp. (ex Codakia rugifera)]|nr:hypothetical protein [Candidatus Thiodiazotropha sp. (ex Codakia rugifera)]